MFQVSDYKKNYFLKLLDNDYLSIKYQAWFTLEGESS